MGKIVKYTLDSTMPIPLNKKQKAKIKSLVELPDEKIDYSDIPPLTNEFLERASNCEDFHK